MAARPAMLCAPRTVSFAALRTAIRATMTSAAATTKYGNFSTMSRRQPTLVRRSGYTSIRSSAAGSMMVEDFEHPFGVEGIV